MEATLKAGTPANNTELLEAIMRISHSDENVVAPADYRYVLYARKSTDDKDKQTRSLGDQILECEQYAKEHKLKIVGKPIQESESAKEPDIRPRFREMINDLKAGKYDAILAWHPDRLARNMKDAGEIIDLLDKGIIKDLKFKSFSFENSTSGKMLLGITFVLSKQYSDHLSESVSRGNERSIEEGKYISKAKHGYYKDPNQYLRPDGENFLLIEKAFRMRLAGQTMEAIANYLNESGYQRWEKDGTHSIHKFNKGKIEEILTDCIYTGVLWYGQNDPVDLTQIYDFRPMLTVEEFMRINKVTKKSETFKLSKSYRRPEAVKASLMRQMVICAGCKEETTTGISSNKKGGTKRLYYRCDTIGCARKSKSTRGKVVMDYIYAFLERKPFSTKSAYTYYKEEMQKVSAMRMHEAKSAIASLRGKKHQLEERLQRIKNVIASDEEDRVKESYRGDFKVVEKDIAETKVNIEKAQALINAGKVGILTYAEFIELIEKMPQTMRRIKNMQELDYICRKIFLNFTVESKKVVNATLNEPFRALYDLKVLNGGGVGN